MSSNPMTQDNFIQLLLADRRVARSTMEHCLNKKFLATLNLDTVELASADIIEDLQLCHNEVVYQMYSFSLKALIYVVLQYHIEPKRLIDLREESCQYLRQIRKRYFQGRVMREIAAAGDLEAEDIDLVSIKTPFITMVVLYNGMSRDSKPQSWEVEEDLDQFIDF